MTQRTTLLALRLACCVLAAAAPLQGATPPGFQDTLIATIPSPTGLAFTPDGRLLITTQGGVLRVVQNGSLLAASAIDLSARLCTNSERGLLGVAVDPAFAANRFVYLYYTFKKFGVCEQNTAKSPVNRVSRFSLSASSIIDPATELILIDNIPSPNGNHNAGDLHFGKDGYLYISVGDGGCDYAGDSGCGGANDASRDSHVLIGKILRITRDGAIPSDNPFQGTGTGRCNLTGRTTAGQQCQETYASGFRNPFRFAVDPEASGTRLFINDVGQATWEEVNLGRAGADYGWNTREGFCANGSTTNCGPPPATLTNPAFAYGHASGCASITGAAFVPRGVWPAAYDGTYLFGDYVCGSIFVLRANADGSYTQGAFVTGLGTNSAVAMIFGPYGSTQALYYTSYAGGGQVRRIAYTGNRSPTATATASPASGPVPLSVRFDASGSSDPDGDALSFDWNFGDGTPHATAAIVTHSYSTAGQFTAVVTVTDARGASATASLPISAGNTPPVPKITSPTTTSRFAVGQIVALRGSATDAEQGTLPDSALSWTVVLHHNTHTHPFLPPTAGNAVSITAPAPEDLLSTTTSYLEIRLTATDAQGASATTSQRFDPRLVDLTLTTQPTGLTVAANELALVSPGTVTSWQGHVIRLRAAVQNDGSGQPWVPLTWSDGGALDHTIVTPAAPATYAAAFAAATRLAATADTFVRGGTYSSTTFGTRDTVELKLSTDPTYVRETYVKFDLRSVATIGVAKVRLFGAMSDTRATNVPASLFGVAATGWSETSLTWSNRPAASTPVLGSAVIAGAVPAWLEWDVTSYLRSEKAAGRNVVSFVFRAASASSPHAAFHSREHTSNVPELLVTAQNGGNGSGDIVRYAGDASRLSGAWRLVSDSTAAGGLRATHPDAGASKLSGPIAAPVNFVEFTFDAQAGTPYRLWLRGRADANSWSNDSVFVQFSGSVDSAGQAVYRIGSTSATTVVLEDCTGCGLSGWGWQDNGSGSGVLGPAIRFAVTGPQTIRIQTREDGMSIDQVVLSPATYLSTAPGAAKNDTTIVPR